MTVGHERHRKHVIRRVYLQAMEEQCSSFEWKREEIDTQYVFFRKSGRFTKRPVVLKLSFAIQQ